MIVRVNDQDLGWVVAAPESQQKSIERCSLTLSRFLLKGIFGILLDSCFFRLSCSMNLLVLIGAVLPLWHLLKTVFREHHESLVCVCTSVTVCYYFLNIFNHLKYCVCIR